TSYATGPQRKCHPISVNFETTVSNYQAASTDGCIELHDAFDGLLHGIVTRGKRDPNELIPIDAVKVHPRNDGHVGPFQHICRIVHSIAVVVQDLFGDRK